MLRQRGVDMAVLSTETNPVLLARCRKLGLPCQHGLKDKVSALRALVAEKGLDLERVMYVGNDINDLGCMNAVGYAVAVGDAHPTVLEQADLVLSARGGFGAIRELCDLLLQHQVRSGV
jgi:YrbI family 3-deoxy-D-manno-octulosonate 8-phosphate phosphatase